VLASLEIFSRLWMRKAEKLTRLVSDIEKILKALNLADYVE
jgi:hypothetical protein